MIYFYLLLSVLVLVLFICRYHIASQAYAVIVILALVNVLILPVYHPVVIALLSFASLLPLLRLVYLCLREMSGAFSCMGIRQSLRAIQKTGLLWLPFPLFAMMGYYLLEMRNDAIQQQSENAIYGLELSIASDNNASVSNNDSAIYSCGAHQRLVCRCEQYTAQSSLANHLSIKDCPLVDRVHYVVKDSSGEIERDIHSAIQRIKIAFRQDIVQRIDNALDKNSRALNNKGANIKMILFGNGSFNDKPVFK